MKNPLVRQTRLGQTTIIVGKCLFRAYIIWSVVADIILLAGVFALWSGGIKISF